MALTVDDPPKTLPRGSGTWRPPNAGSGSVVVSPRETWVARGQRPGNGDVQQGVPVAATGLDQEHAGFPVCGQAVGKDAAGRTRTDDDVVIRGGHGSGFTGWRKVEKASPRFH